MAGWRPRRAGDAGVVRAGHVAGWLPLESLAIRRAADVFGDEHARNAQARLEALHQMPDDNSAATSTAHTAFHFALYEAAGSAWLTRLIRRLWETAERYCVEHPECRQLRAHSDEHQAILQACIDHHPGGAAGALEAHLTATETNIAAAMASRELSVRGTPA